MLQQPKAFSSADGDLVLLHLLQLIDPIANIHPTASTGILDDRISWIFLRSDFVYRFSITFYDLAGVACPDSSGEHGGVCSDGDVSNWEEVVLGVVIGVDVDLSGCDEDERWVDVDRELDVSVFITVQLKFSLLFGRLIEGLVLLLLVLHLLLYDLVHLA